MIAPEHDHGVRGNGTGLERIDQRANAMVGKGHAGEVSLDHLPKGLEIGALAVKLERPLPFRKAAGGSNCGVSVAIGPKPVLDQACRIPLRLPGRPLSS